MRFVKSSWSNSLSFKVLLAYVVGTVLTIVLVSALTFVFVFYKSDWLASKDLMNFTHKMADALLFDLDGQPIGFGKHDDELNWIFDSLHREAAYRVLSEDGRVMLGSAATLGIVNTVLVAAKDQFQKVERGGLAYYSAASTYQHQGQSWIIQFAVSQRFYNLMHKGFALPFMVFGVVLFSLVMLFVFGGCAYITLRCTLNPLRDISESAAKISPRSLNERLSAANIPTEIVPLVDSFNRVLARLENGYRIQREFLATAAHELKTPLALIRAQIEMQDKTPDRLMLLNDIEHMSRQVQQLLLLAEVSEEQNFKLDRVDVVKTANEVLIYLLPMAKAADVQVRIKPETIVIWEADNAALFILIKNLLENAIQHAPIASEIRIDIDATQLSLRDWGPGVEQDELAVMFERFWRGPHRRDHGAGLGLAICSEIAQTHGWQLSAHNRIPGLCFTLVNTNLLTSRPSLV